MNYLLFIICSDGLPAPEELAVMQRELPGWVEEVERRGVRLLGRELDLPQTAATVRVRDGETPVTDGPFAETKEFIAGFDLLECADLDEAIEVAATSPICRFQTLEIRPFPQPLRLHESTSAFARGDDRTGTPFLLSTWVGRTPGQAPDEPVVTDQGGAWRSDLRACGLHVLGDALGGADTATTLRVRDGQTLINPGPAVETDAFIAGIDVVSCPDHPQAIVLAAAHPLARSHAIEVRPFYSE
jgi:hypothetical protein